MTLNQFLQFTFQSFWHFLGVVIILGIPVKSITTIIVAFINGIFNQNPFMKNQDDEK